MSDTAKKIYHGIVKDRQVVLDEEFDLPEGAAVEVRPADAAPRTAAPGTARKVLEALESPPYLCDGDVAELRRQIDAGRRPVRFGTPLDD